MWFAETTDSEKAEYLGGTREMLLRSKSAPIFVIGGTWKLSGKSSPSTTQYGG
ncbi:hypothetical protein JCM19239_7271 [Vibrio variabilis]|uniref:Uncharacterized protein n=1 Tax=Vibrio variabilis TaxID=990271 RepID=A0ABQ0J7E9_9VIBR|nr:hypothetical protein JCM19239_7271 [Vibrio variabilis]